MDTNSVIFLAGSTGMVGSAILRALKAKGYERIIGSYHNRLPETAGTSGRITADAIRHVRLDLTEQQAVNAFFEKARPDCVFMAAAKVGGIYANNTYPAQFIHDNLVMQSNVIHAAHCFGVQQLLFLGSSCIYPRLAEQPIRESALLTGALEPTNEPYAVAKIAGIKMCESYNRQYGRDYRSVLPTNLYGPNDNFHPQDSHVVAALMRRFHEAVCNGAEKVVIWGSGNPRREFLHVDDMAEACVFLMESDLTEYRRHTTSMLSSHLNIGSGVDCTIRELAEIMARVTGYAGGLVFDTSKPDGTPRKRLDVARLKSMGWEARIGLEEGLQQVYSWFLENEDRILSSG